MASAGHPPVLVRDPDGRVPGWRRRRAAAGTGIGPFEELVTPFPPGSVLAAYTDGLVESREVDVELGMARLAARLEEAGPTRDLEELADELLTAAGADRRGGRRRAAAGAAVAAAPRSCGAPSCCSPSSPTSPRPPRRRSGRGRHPAGAGGCDRAGDRELAANAVEHAGPPVELRAFATAQRLVVRDDRPVGAAAGAPPLRPGGRARPRARPRRGARRRLGGPARPGRQDHLGRVPRLTAAAADRQRRVRARSTYT